MKRLFCILLLVALLLPTLSACDRKPAESPAATQATGGNFAPETTAVTSGGLTQAADQLNDVTEAPTQAPVSDQAAPADQPMAQDEAVSQAPEVTPETTPEPAETTAAPQPFTTATPQPNTSISSYSEVAASGLGFRFSYPSNWTNIPGRSTVCYVQPKENGTVYPARVTVTMKRLAHKCNANEPNEDRSELADYVKNLMTQYNEKTFKVDTALDEGTKFMGNKAISTTYLAYDGDQEIQGYVILTYFERYLFVYHFLCAYEDYAAFEPAMRHMRDSVQADQNLLD